MRRKTLDVLTAKHGKSSLELTEDIIRTRAYLFYEERGYEDGHDLEDWIRAEREVIGNKLASADGQNRKGRIRAAAA